MIISYLPWPGASQQFSKASTPVCSRLFSATAAIFRCDAKLRHTLATSQRSRWQITQIFPEMERQIRRAAKCIAVAEKRRGSRCRLGLVCGEGRRGFSATQSGAGWRSGLSGVEARTFHWGHSINVQLWRLSAYLVWSTGAHANSCQKGANRDAVLDKVATRSYLEEVRIVGLKVLKNKLSECVRLVATGETVLITDRDRVVAELVPPREGRSPFVADATLAEAVRQGWISVPPLRAAGPPPRKPVMRYAELAGELAADREDR